MKRYFFNFFAISKDAELRFSRKNFFPSDQTRLSTFKSDAVIIQHFFDKGLFADFRGFLSYLLHAAAKIGKFELAVFIRFG